MVAENDRLVAWLQDAYAMEAAQDSILEKLGELFDDSPEIAADLEAHQAATRQHLVKIGKGLEILKQKPEASRSLPRSVASILRALNRCAADGEPIKSLLLLHATEHLEHATYRALAEAAGTAGQEEIATDSEEIADQELDMADWTEVQLLELVRRSTDKLQPA